MSGDRVLIIAYPLIHPVPLVYDPALPSQGFLVWLGLLL